MYLRHIIIDITSCYPNHSSETLLNNRDEMINVCFCLGGRSYVCKLPFLFGKRNLIGLTYLASYF